MNYFFQDSLRNRIFDRSLFLAPLAGITDYPFRCLARRMGAGLVFTEMVSAEALVRGNPATLRMYSTAGRELPLAVQIFGASPDVMAEAARIAVVAGAGAIDVNMGCPQPKIVGSGAGAVLMRDHSMAGRLVKAVVDAAAPVPVTVKIRLGWDESELNAPVIARAVEDAGASLVTVHGRTRRQMFSGRSDWRAIRVVKEAVSIPVIANGDIRSRSDMAKALGESGADGVMIGRAAMTRPWIFRELSGADGGAPILQEQYLIVLEYLDDAEAFDPGSHDVWKVRRNLAWFSRGLAGGPAYRNALSRAGSYRAIRDIAGRFYESLPARSA